MGLFQSSGLSSLFCLLSWTHAAAFNLDTRNVLRKNGEPGSLFGFSLAMHRQLRPTDKMVLLIGAPHAKALAQQRANITGGLYSCDITTQLNDCKRVQIDNEVDLTVENKENQWMGVSVQSQGPGGKIVTCAHRYQMRHFGNTPQESRSITGRCYMLSEDLSISSEEDGGLWNFCEGRGSGYERFGFCQQGLSATFTQDYHYIVFGAPGAYSWKGTVRVEQRNSTLLDLGYFDDGPYEVGDENLLDPDLVPVPPNSYLGFSVDSGHSISSKGQLTIVSGAPRANHSGAVVLLKKESEASYRLSEEFILEGPGLASSFGYDVAVLDLNGDGWQDIAVGAPQFFLKDREVGGAVFIYINQEGHWDTVVPIPLYGLKDSMFGLAVEKVGDVTQDSYEDLAVGAPYDGAGAGRVYIYHGSSHGITTTPAQILEGHDHNVKLFGYSLAGNMDLDRNSYPDLAIGSLSDAVFVYRARPTVHIDMDIKTSPKEIDMTEKTCGNSVCLTVNACFTYTANHVSYNPKLTIAYSITVESDRRKQGLPSRVAFVTDTKSPEQSQGSGSLELRGQRKRSCISAELKLQDGIQDRTQPIAIQTSVSIKSIRRRTRHNSLPDLLPVLSSGQPSKIISEVGFLRQGCGIDNICQSNLQLQYKFFYREHSKDVFVPLPVENGMPVMSLSGQRALALEVTVTNSRGEDAHDAQLVGRFPPALRYSAFHSPRATAKQVLCVANQNGSQTNCALGNPFKRDSEVSFFILLTPGDISLNTTEVEIDLQFTAASEQRQATPVKARVKVLMELFLSVSGVAKPSQVYFRSQNKRQTAIKTEEEIGSLIDYQFRIKNSGKPLKSPGTASLHIQWPKENADGKYILYLVKISSHDLDDVQCTPEQEINPIKSIKESSISRSKREDRDGAADEDRFSPFTTKRKRKILTCASEARCVEIRCPLLALDRSADVSLRFRLWNSTFSEDYANWDYLKIVVKAFIRLDDSARNKILRNSMTEVSVTAFPERVLMHYGGMLWWIVLLGVLAGLLMLALLVFLLWKCGFFSITNKDQHPEASGKAGIHAPAPVREAQT
ncbi:integrin alpha-6-like [Conger conger]|uniref:integrin alpha-6-like n=1 Tax=Conger conger TaxID=82655 RepID=UPI002A5AB280|nr:integrin alpha-6-like [Conger conger]